MDIFLARQPVFDRHRRVFAYELLFRNGFRNAFDFPDGSVATRQVMLNSFLVFGMPALTGGRPAFINLTRDVLVSGSIHLFPKDAVIPELLESIEPDPQVLNACKELKAAGYRLALDDFVSLRGYEPLAELADFVKVDFLQTSESQRRELAAYFKSRGTGLLAEKVETYADFSTAVGMGYEHFQGYFFAKPEVLCKKDVPGYKLHRLELLRQIHREDFDFDHLAELIKPDVSLSYRMLRYVNSAFFGRPVEIHSIRHALSLIGERDIRKLATLMAMSAMAEDKPPELLVSILSRARFCEEMGQLLRRADQAPNLFLMGMFSGIDALLDRPIDEIIGDIPLALEVREALLGGPGPLRDVLDMAIAYERADWDEVVALAQRIGVPEDNVPSLYFNAIEWSRASFEAATR